MYQTEQLFLLKKSNIALLLFAYRMAQVFGTTIEELCCLKENKEMEDKKHESKE